MNYDYYKSKPRLLLSFVEGWQRWVEMHSPSSSRPRPILCFWESESREKITCLFFISNYFLFKINLNLEYILKLHRS